MMNDIRFYDTSSLLIAGESLFNKREKFIISSITLKELEQIKTSNKDSEVKYSARLLLRLLDEYSDNYEVIIHSIDYEEPLSKYDLYINNDSCILMDAYHYNNVIRPDEVIFVTNDLALKQIAFLFFGDGMVESVTEDTDDYTGYKEVILSDEALAAFYEDQYYNHFDLEIGEYLIIRNNSSEIVDLRAWTGQEHRFLNYDAFNSKQFGKVSPFKSDVYQKLVFDSLRSNKITMVKGPAGSGKTYISLAFLMSQLEHGEIDKIVIFCNTVATANSAKLGYLPGDRETKLLDSQIGNLLMSKFNGKDRVETLIAEKRLILLPMSDIRGFDTSGMRAGVYISEAQNLDRTLIKLALQRIGEDCICIIDGDYNQQVDMAVYAGNNNGMRRVSKVFRGQDIYGEIELRNIYRSRIACIAEDI